jgi:methionyl-tRNA formyltransferase
VNIIFLGTPEFAVPTLKSLAQSDHKVLVDISQPDRPRNRGMQLAPPPIKKTAINLGIPVLQPQKASAPPVVKEIDRFGADAAVVVAYGQLLKPNFLSAFRYGCINLHASLLPKYRGPSPIQAAILAGDQETGVTTMLLNEGMDTGDILLQRIIEIKEEDTAGTLHEKLAAVGAPLVVETLDRIERREIIPQPQDEKQASITHKITKADAKINWNRPAKGIFDQARAFDPWPGCETTLHGRLLKIWKVVRADGSEKQGEPGEVLVAEDDKLIVKVRDGALRIQELQPAGGKRMPSADFLRGHPISPGAVLGA